MRLPTTIHHVANNVRFQRSGDASRTGANLSHNPIFLAAGAGPAFPTCRLRQPGPPAGGAAVQQPVAARAAAAKAAAGEAAAQVTVAAAVAPGGVAARPAAARVASRSASPRRRPCLPRQGMRTNTPPWREAATRRAANPPTRRPCENAVPLSSRVDSRHLRDGPNAPRVEPGAGSAGFR